MKEAIICPVNETNNWCIKKDSGKGMRYLWDDLEWRDYLDGGHTNGYHPSKAAANQVLEWYYQSQKKGVSHGK